MHAVSSNISYTARNETHERVVRYLCELPADRGVDLSAYDNYAIRSAAVNGHVNVYLCELPADRGVRPGAHDNSAIRWAVQYGHVNVVRYLCELPGDRGVDPAAHISDAMYCHLTTAQPPGLPTPSTNSSYCLRGGCVYRPGPYQHLLARMKARASVLVLHALVRACRGGITGD